MIIATENQIHYQRPRVEMTATVTLTDHEQFIATNKGHDFVVTEIDFDSTTINLHGPDGRGSRLMVVAWWGDEGWECDYNKHTGPIPGWVDGAYGTYTEALKAARQAARSAVRQQLNEVPGLACTEEGW